MRFCLLLLPILLCSCASLSRADNKRSVHLGTDIALGFIHGFAK